jgi:hypothetical protein
MMATLCRHCDKPIKPCDCGADGQRHWVDDDDSRHCPRHAIRLHEPAAPTSREAGE